MPNRKARRAALFAERKLREELLKERLRIELAQPKNEQPYSRAPQNRTPENFCKWNGEADVRVLDEVLIKPPPSFLAQYDAGQIENKAHNDKTRLIGWLTLLAVCIYAGLTAWQAKKTSDAVQVARDANALTLESVRARLIFSGWRFSKPIAIGQKTAVESQLKNIGRSQAIYGIKTDSKRWQGMPDGEMPVADPDLSTPLEFDNPTLESIIEVAPVTQDYIDHLPNLADIVAGRLDTFSPTTTLLISRKPTTYFFGKIIYDSVGSRRELDFCFYIIRADGGSQQLGFPEDITGDPNFLFISCPKWNEEHVKK